VGTDHADRIASFPFLANGKSNDRRPVACEIVLSTGLEGGRPRISFLHGWLLPWHDTGTRASKKSRSQKDHGGSQTRVRPYLDRLKAYFLQALLGRPYGMEGCTSVSEGHQAGAESLTGRRGVDESEEVLSCFERGLGCHGRHGTWYYTTM